MCEDAIVQDNKSKRLELQEGERYVYCICGRSAKGAFCDGSHRAETTCKPIRFSVEATKIYGLCMCKSSGNLPFCDGTHNRYSAEEVGKPVTKG